MKTNNFKILMFILFALTAATAARAQQSGEYAPRIEKIRPDATQISGRVGDALFSPSGEWMVLQTDCGFFVLPATRLDEAIGALEKSRPHQGEARGFLPFSGKIVYTTARGLFALDAATLESQAIFQATDTDAPENGFAGATFVVSENLIVAEDGGYEKGLEKGGILRFDARGRRVARGAQIHSFNEGSLSPNGRYIFYSHPKAFGDTADIYDIRLDVNRSLVKGFNLERHFADFKIITVAPLAWVAPDRFAARIDAYRRDDYNVISTWLVLLDAAGGKVVWKKEQESNGEIALQRFDSARALLEKNRELYELSLASGKAAQISDLEGTTFVVSPNKKRLAYLKDDQVFVARANGADEKSILDLPADWRGRLLYDGTGVRRLDWSHDGSRLLVYGDTRLLIIKL